MSRDTQEQPNPEKPAEFQKFEEGMKQLLSVPKSELDRRLAEEKKPKRTAIKRK